MNNFFKGHVNLRDKNLKWHNTNFFYISTIVMVVAMVVIYSFFKSQIGEIATNHNFWNVYLMSFNHVSVVHVTFNAIMFVLLSLLLERHFGSFTYFIMLIFIIPLSNLTYFAAKALFVIGGGTWTGAGESCVNNFLLGFILVVAAFNYRKYVLSKNAFIFFIPLAIVIFLSSVNSNDVQTPADFFEHPSMRFMDVFYTNPAGHFAPFVVGIVVGLLIFTILSTTKLYNEKQQDKNIT